MATSTVVQRKDNVFKLLKDSSVEKIFLSGVSGVGKTWTARQASNCAIRDGFFDITLWVNRECDEKARQKSIDRQLYLFSLTEEGEARDGNEKAKKEEQGEAGDGNEKPKEEQGDAGDGNEKAKKEEQGEAGDGNEKAKEELNHKDLKKMITKSLPKKKRVLLILDGEGDNMDVEDIMSKLKTLLDPQYKIYKVIITSRNTPPGGVEGVIPVEPLSEEESLSLLKEKVGRKVYEVPANKDLPEACIKKTKNLPASIILVAKAFKYFGQQDSGAQMLLSKLKEVSDNESYNTTHLLRSGYDVLPRSILLDCCWPGRHFFRDCGSFHYSELIAYWILEGYLGYVDCIEKAYKMGHSFFMELVDWQVLKKQDGDYVIMDTKVINLDDYARYGFWGTASLGLADMLENSGWEGFGRITQAEGMIRSICKGEMGQECSTLFLTENCAKDLDDLIRSKQRRQDLQVLAIFNLTLKSVTQLFSDMDKLLVLVLRSCAFLEKIEHKFELQKLTFLEISNASSLKTIPNDFFDHMLQLRTVHISELKVDPLPSSLYNLKKLRWLILKGCSCFKTLGSLKTFEDLEVLDVSGAASLMKFKDKTFQHNSKLQKLNLSYTSIEDTPKFRKLGELTHLSLSGCKLLERLPKTDALTRLETLDLSGAREFYEFHEQSPELPRDLKILDLSQTSIKILPSEINPCHLFLKRCSQLRKLPFIEELKILKILDLSGTKSLDEIDDKFFSHLNSLQNLNLSETSIKILPPLSNLHKLSHLLLSGCTNLILIKDESFEKMSSLQHLDLSESKIDHLPSLSKPSNLTVLSLKKCTNLKELPPLDSLSNLVELNLSGITSLGKTADFLEDMSHLQILDLSETQLEQLPSTSKLTSLCQLSLRDCQHLETLPNLKELTRLEVLDLSGTAVTDLPRLDNFSNLRQLLLRGCSRLEGFRHMKRLDFMGTADNELPYGISKLTNLELLDLPNIMNIEEAESRNISLPEVVDPCLWGISSFDKPSVSVNGIQFLQFLKKNFSFMEICGFNLFPEGVGDVLCNADYVFFTNSTLKKRFNMTFKKWLSDNGVSSLEAMKGCWIERCPEMEGVFDAETEDDIDELENALKLLSISNAINSNTICCGNLHCRVFQNLECLYLDCCPKLSTVFTSSQLPENLRVLQVKFCDKLESVFEQTSEEPELKKLETLHLWELPELKTIGCKSPSLQTLKVWECPKLQKLEDSIRLAESLETLCIANVNLKSIYIGSQKLEKLILDSCPILENIISSSQPPQIPKTLKIKFCNQLKTVFEKQCKLSDFIMQ